MNIKPKIRLRVEPVEVLDRYGDNCHGCFFALAGSPDFPGCRKRVSVCYPEPNRMLIFKEVKPNGD